MMKYTLNRGRGDIGTMYKNILDMHTHTDNSFDGNHPAMYLCETAEIKGLRGIAFTDHVEMDCFKEHCDDKTAKQSYFESCVARATFSGKLIVCVGVELGEATYDKAESEKLMRTYNYDFVAGSIHNLRGEDDFCFYDYNAFSREEIHDLLDEYFDEELKLAQWGKVDTITHLTYPLRYICGECGVPVDISCFSEKLDAIFEAIAKNNIALEINTSGLRQKLGKTMPDEYFIRRYKELGGKYITIGSDAHYAKDLGAGIQEGMDLAARCGFDSFTLFQKREPILITIE